MHKAILKSLSYGMGTCTTTQSAKQVLAYLVACTASPAPRVAPLVATGSWDTPPRFGYRLAELVEINSSPMAAHPPPRSRDWRGQQCPPDASLDSKLVCPVRKNHRRECQSSSDKHAHYSSYLCTLYCTTDNARQDVKKEDTVKPL